MFPLRFSLSGAAQSGAVDHSETNVRPVDNVVLPVISMVGAWHLSQARIVAGFKQFGLDWNEP
jgi:hypothetical protein